MSLRAAIAQCVWACGNLGAAGRFNTALGDPERAQKRWLLDRLAADSDCIFGNEHGFHEIRSYQDFTRRVPLRTWDDYEPWVKRIQAGEPSVLGTERVTHLAPTSGSSGARKLIPFTASLHCGFSEAVGAWMTDLTRLEPGLLSGSAYWSISPLASDDANESGAVPVGFADDAEYLGGLRSWLVRQALAVPSETRHERDPETFWKRTMACLLERRDLRLISIWHPSFLDLLLEAAEKHWNEILHIIGGRRASELRRIGLASPERWWPRLRVISCWGEQAAEPGWRALRDRFPSVRVQPKGLLATEAAVTIPWRESHVLAVNSHFFEFLDDAGETRLAHELETGSAYEVVVTNGGGLWRYRLGDLVECTGHIGRTPTLRFLGRAGNVIDLRGEKLSESFVAGVFAEIWPDESRPAACLRAVVDDDGTARYELVVSVPVSESVRNSMEALLCRNPHYALALRLRQLAPLRVVVDPGAFALKADSGMIRLGDIKPRILVAG
jgi:hypothetical protein